MAAKKKKAAAKKRKPQLVPWQLELQPTADEYMHRSLRLIRQTGLHPCYLVSNAAALCALMANPDVVLPSDEEHTASGPVLHEWDRQAVYEEAAALLPDALPWARTRAGKPE